MPASNNVCLASFSESYYPALGDHLRRSWGICDETTRLTANKVLRSIFLRRASDCGDPGVLILIYGDPGIMTLISGDPGVLILIYEGTLG